MGFIEITGQLRSKCLGPAIKNNNKNNTNHTTTTTNNNNNKNWNGLWLEWHYIVELLYAFYPNMLYIYNSLDNDCQIVEY